MQEVRIDLARMEDEAIEFLPLIEKAPNAFYLDFFKEVRFILTLAIHKNTFG